MRILRTGIGGKGRERARRHYLCRQVHIGYTTVSPRIETDYLILICLSFLLQENKKNTKTRENMSRFQLQDRGPVRALLTIVYLTVEYHPSLLYPPSVWEDSISSSFSSSSFITPTPFTSFPTSFVSSVIINTSVDGWRTRMGPGRPGCHRWSNHPIRHRHTSRMGFVPEKTTKKIPIRTDGISVSKPPIRHADRMV